MYPPGTPVEIQADTPPRGQRFYRWMGDTEGMRKVRNTTTRLPMPDAEAWVAATYRPSKHNGQVTVGGQLEQWHKVVVDLNGPYASETSLPNPFMDFRYQVAFVGPNQQRLDVPGFFAGDGKGGSAGNTWRAFFRPDQAGQWNYTISLRQGNQVAVDPDDEAGQPLPPYDGTTGTFTVGPSSARVPDFRSPDRGALRNQGGRYPTFANGQPFYYVGVGIPENILAYPGFDNTNLGWALPFKGYEQHYQDGDPRWQNEDGVADKALIGAINHLAEQGGNVIVVRPIDLGSDGNGVFPFISPAEKTRYGLSKLAQWEILFEHAQAKGIYLSVMIDETQSDEDFFPDDGAQGLGSARKLYYRMINAIMGHHNGQKMVISGKAEDSEALHGNPSQAFFKQPSINPYDTLVMFPAGFRSKPEGDSELQQANQRDTPATPLLLGDINLFDYAVQIRRQSANSGAPAIAQLDRPLNIQPAIDGSEYDDALAGIRNQLWSFLMGGGSGLAGYVRAEGARQESDQRIDDFLLRPEALNWSRHARSFFEALPVQQMQSSRALAFSQRAIPTFVFYQPGEIYAIYTGANGGPITLDLSDATGEFTVQWYDPRTGEFLDGTVHSVQGGESVDLGAAPRDPTMDWAALVKRK